MHTQSDETREERKNKAKELRARAGLSQFKFASKYNIPLSTIQNWEIGRTIAPDYVLDLLERAIKEDFQ